jgi:hypothetical protein
MQRKIISGRIKTPEERRQKELHRQLGVFTEWIKRPKDTSEIRKDKRKSVPVQQLPMVF